MTLEEAKENYNRKKIFNKFKACNKCEFSRPYGFTYTYCNVKEHSISFEIINAMTCKYYQEKKNA